MRRTTIANVILRGRIHRYLRNMHAVTIALALLPAACSAGSGDIDPGIVQDSVASAGVQQELRVGAPDPGLGEPGLVAPAPTDPVVALPVDPVVAPPVDPVVAPPTGATCHIIYCWCTGRRDCRDMDRAGMCQEGSKECKVGSDGKWGCVCTMKGGG